MVVMLIDVDMSWYKFINYYYLMTFWVCDLRAGWSIQAMADKVNGNDMCHVALSWVIAPIVSRVVKFVVYRHRINRNLPLNALGIFSATMTVITRVTHWQTMIYWI